MKVVLVADIHFHNYKMFAKNNGQSVNSRLHEHIDAMDIVLKYCIEHNIDRLWILGDLFHARDKIDVAVNNAVYRLFKKYKNKVNTTLLVGNHGLNFKGQEVSSLPLGEIIEIKAEPEAEIIDGVWVFWLPAGYGLDSLDKIMGMVDGRGGMKKILLGHFGVNGAIVQKGYRPRSEIEVSDIERYGFDMVFLGDYHKRQFVKDNILYVGSLCHHDFREVGYEDGFIVLELDDLFYESYGIDAPKFIEVDMIEDVPKGGEYYVKLRSRLKGKIPSNVKGIKEDIISVVKDKENKVRFKQGMSVEEMIGKYVDSQDIGELDRDKLIKIGIDITKGGK